MVQAEDVKFVVIFILLGALIMALLLPLLLGTVKPKVFYGTRLARYQVRWFSSVACLSALVAGYLLVFFNTSDRTSLMQDRQNLLIFCGIIAFLAGFNALAARWRR